MAKEKTHQSYKALIAWKVSGSVIGVACIWLHIVNQPAGFRFDFGAWVPALAVVLLWLYNPKPKSK